MTKAFPNAWLPAFALDLESVLTPEIWHAVAHQTGLDELLITTREVADYDRLMKRRMSVCRANGLTLPRLRRIVRGMDPLPGAMEFLRWARQRAVVTIVSDTFHELASPLLAKLGVPLTFCNTLRLDDAGGLRGYQRWHCRGKPAAVELLRREGFRVAAVGDSFNDLSMLGAADFAVLFRAPTGIDDGVRFRRAENHRNLKTVLSGWLMEKNSCSDCQVHGSTVQGSAECLALRQCRTAKQKTPSPSAAARTGNR